jgi:secreted trypsin-like serine protease
MSQPFPSNIYFSVVKLSSTSPPVASLVRAVGWGHTASQREISPVLRRVWLRIGAASDCASSPPFNTTDSWWSQAYHGLLCAKGPNKSICKGDSGGPLLYVDNGGHYLQVGLSSFSEGCAQNWGFFPNIPLYIPWISSILAERGNPRQPPSVNSQP